MPFSRKEGSMSLVKEIEQVIAKLPLPKARILKHLLNEYQAACRYKRLIKTYAMANKAVASFQKSNGKALWN